MSDELKENGDVLTESDERKTDEKENTRTEVEEDSKNIVSLSD